MRKLNAVVLRFQLRHLFGMSERIEGQRVVQFALFCSESEVQPVVQSCQQHAAVLQNAEAFAPDGQHLADVDVGNGMENQVKALVFKRQRLAHVRANRLDGIPLPFRQQTLGFELARGVIEHSAVRTQCGKDGHLLPAAAGQTQHLFAVQISKPAVRHGLGGREYDIPFSGLGRQKGFVRDGLTPFPAFFDPTVNRSGVDLLVIHGKHSL